MSRQADIFERDVRAAQRELPADFKWAGRSLTGQVTELAGNLEMEDAGTVQKTDFELMVLKSAFRGIKVLADEDVFKMTSPESYRGEYRVVKSSTSQDDLVLTYTVSRLNEKA